MRILVLNCGSSSLKYQLFNMEDESVMAKGLVEKIGLDGANLAHQPEGKDKVVINTDIPDHTKAISLVLEALTDPAHGVLKDMSEIKAVGHRTVHGGAKYADSVKIDDAVVKEIYNLVELAPLHNPPSILGIEACRKLMADVPMVAVFDTAFHQTMQPQHYLYGIPYEYYEKYGIRRYGFHGTSHRYVSQRVADLLKKDIANLKLITCHLGNGSSIAAIDGGRVVDTSMGFTPLEGLLMGTRSGDMDPAIVTFLMEKENLAPGQLNDILNKKSGLLGISGVSNDMRDVEQAAADGNDRAKLALEVFLKRITSYIGAYAAEMNGVDGIIFTAGIGENSASARAAVLNSLTFLGLELDAEANQLRGEDTRITKDGSKVQAWVIPTNEELMIARDTLELVAH